MTSVWVGNIPYDATEEELIKFFSSVADVKSFSLITDPSTGRSKGFGFCNFADAAAAESAVRNLNGKQLHDRPLRVDLATPRNQRESSRHHGPGPSHDRNKGAPPPAAAAEPEPKRSKLYGEASPAGQNASRIAETLEKAPLAKVHQTLKQMKGFAMKQPREARALLSSQPQLAYAFLQALLRLGMIDTAMAERLTVEAKTSSAGPGLLPSGPPPPAPSAPRDARAPPPREAFERSRHDRPPPPPHHRRERFERGPYPPYERGPGFERFPGGHVPGRFGDERGPPPPPHHRHERRDMPRHPEREAARHGAPPPPRHPGHPPPPGARPAAMQRQPGGPAPPPPAQGQPPPPPPQQTQPPQQPQQQPQAPAAGQIDKQGVIDTALRMSEEEIARMPAHVAETLRKIRRKYGISG